VAPLKGNTPVNVTKVRTPKAQMSAGSPRYYLFCTISGAM